MKTFADYEASAARTDKEHPLEYYALGVAGEAGEVADAVKKGVYHGGVLDRAKIIKEMGDTLWYLARLSAKLGITLGEVAQVNAIKLAKRYPNGYSDEASAARADVEEPKACPLDTNGDGDCGRHCAHVRSVDVSKCDPALACATHGRCWTHSTEDEDPPPEGPLGATLRRMRGA